MKVRLPYELESRFDKLHRRLFRVQSIETLLAFFVCLAVSFLIVFISDRLAESPAVFRFVVLMIGILLAGMALARWVFRWVFSPPTIKSLAVLVQRRYRQLGDGLLGIVELAEESAMRENFSRELYEAAIAQVSNDALDYDFEKAVSKRLQHRLMGGAMTLAIVCLFLTMLVPDAMTNAFARWITPHRSIPRYTLVRMHDLKTADVVVYGEPFEVNAKVEYLSFWKPNVAIAQFEDEAPLDANVENGMLRVNVPSQHEMRMLQVRLGDESARLQIEPVFRPKLLRVNVEAKLPEYLRYPNQDLKIAGGMLEVLEGSKIILSGEVSRELSSATLHLDSQIQNEIQNQNAIQNAIQNEMTISGMHFQSDLLDLTNHYEAVLKWRDRLGLASDPWEFSIAHQSDQAPSIEVPELGIDTAILETEVLAIRVLTRDDFGVNEFGLNWRTSEGFQPSAELLRKEFWDSSLNASQKELDVNFYFSPAIYEIPAGATVVFKGFVSDFFPKRKPIESDIYRVHIVSSAEHAELIRSRLESLLTHLEEISRLQEKLAAASEALGEHLDLSPATIENRLQNQLDDQAMNATQLEHLARQGLELLREAMRNTQFSDAMMQQWTETLSDMQSLAGQKMGEASRFLNSAKQNPSHRAQDLTDAHEIQEEILQALANMQTAINEDLDGMEAMTLAQRLRALGTGQREIESALMGKVAETIGLFPDELAPRFQAMNEGLAEREATAGNESQSLQEEISRFFERTEREAYGAVSEAMKEKGVVEGLLGIEALIKDNITMQASEALAIWGDQFEDWARLLEPPPSDDPSGGGGGGGGGGESQLDLTKHLMALLRLRESELTLRAQTRLIERRKDDETFIKRVGELSSSQVSIQDRLIEMMLAHPLPDLDPVLDEAHLEMDRVLEFLSQNETGDPTIQVETRAINAITDGINLINEQAQRRGSSASSMAEQMALMMQMVSMGKGQSLSQTPSGSGNPSGGETNKTATGQDGEHSGAAEPSRSVLRGAGRSEALPTEFRHMFEHYYRELERIEASLPLSTTGEN